MAHKEWPDLYLVCEGEHDKNLLAALIRKILQTEGIDRTVQIVAAHGKQPIPKLVRALEYQVPPDSVLGIVTDSDGDVEQTKSFLSKDLDLARYLIIIAHPHLEAWFDEKATIARQLSRSHEQAWKFVKGTDLSRVACEHPEFNTLLQTITHTHS